MRSKHGRKEKAPHRPALQRDKQAKTGSHRHSNTNHSTTITRSDARMHQSIPSTEPIFFCNRDLSNSSVASNIRSPSRSTAFEEKEGIGRTRRSQDGFFILRV